MKPFSAEAIMKPFLPVVRSSIRVSRAWPPVTAVSKIVALMVSPGFIRRVCALGVFVARLASCGLGGPVGTPSVWMKAKLVGSMHALLQLAKFSVHSRSLMWREAHQWVLSQLRLSTNGANTGG